MILYTDLEKKKIRIVLDTNVIISGTFWTGDSYRILNQIDEEKYILFMTEEIAKEYDKTMNNDGILDKVELKNLKANDVAKRVIENATNVFPIEKINIVKNDPDDNKIIECAVEANADYIITNDNHLLTIKKFRKIEIITPAEFIKIIDN